MYNIFYQLIAFALLFTSPCDIIDLKKPSITMQGGAIVDNSASIGFAGLNSLSGFSYQIKIFIYMMTQMIDGQRVEFETLDDVVVKNIVLGDDDTDNCIKRRIISSNSASVFQVKHTNVTDSVARQVLYNWMLAYHLCPEIKTFEIILDSKYTLSKSAFSWQPDNVLKEIKASSKSPNAIVTHIKGIYGDNEKYFHKVFSYICQNWKMISIENVDEKIAQNLCLPFHASMSDIANPHFGLRIKELFIRICSRIIICAENRTPYACTYGEYMQLCEEICNNISADSFNPDYESFKTLCAAVKLDEQIKQSREFRQLKYCALPDPSIIDHLRWEQYYQNIRQHYLTDAKKSRITQTENVAFQNFTDVVSELQEDNKDTPARRLRQTKRQSISTLSDEYSRWGAYIYLTRDGEEQQISWKDECEDGKQRNT